jgi:N-acetylglucosamine-6-phosphate deacetylase
MNLLFTNIKAILPERLVEDAWVLCEKGKIVSISTKKPKVTTETQIVDGRGGYLSPGFIDIHVHGGNGADFMDGTSEAVRVACRAHARHGTTTIFPTTTTGSTEQIHAMLDAAKAVQAERSVENGAQIAGVHLYGPFFAEDKVGCHSVEGRREPTAAEYRDYFEKGMVRIATCAAELPGAVEFYREAKKRRCLITCGHSNASWPEMAAAFKAGNAACGSLLVCDEQRGLGALTARCADAREHARVVLGTAEMSTEVIADGCHLAPELLEFAFQLKGPRKLCLVTDANRALDLPPGNYRFGAEADGSWFESDGRVGWAPGRMNLASSIVGMDHMVRQMKRDTSATLPEVVRMASLTPAELTGIAKHTGSLEAGKKADVLLLNRKLDVRRVFIGGNEMAL